MSRLYRASLAMVHVRSSADRPGKAGADGSILRELSRRAKDLKAQGIKASILLQQGDAAEEILKSCRPGDLLVITTHGYGGLKRLVLGSVAEKVIHQATVPVLVYKKPAHLRRLPGDLASLELFDS
jgi:nucleotide-binding universal stress UspA family protein